MVDDLNRREVKSPRGGLWNPFAASAERGHLSIERTAPFTRRCRRLGRSSLGWLERGCGFSTPLRAGTCCLRPPGCMRPTLPRKRCPRVERSQVGSSPASWERRMPART